MNELKNHQYALLAFTAPLVFKLVALPSLIAGLSGSDAWITAALFALLDILQITLVYAVSSRGGVTEALKGCSKPILAVIGLPVLFALGFKCLLLLSEASAFISRFMFFNANYYIVVIIFMLTAGYLAIQGGKTSGRIAGALVWLAPLIILLGFSFGRVNLRFDYALPIFSNGKGIFNALDKYMTWSLCALPLMFLTVKKERRNYVGWAGGAYLVFTAAFYITFIASYGAASYLADNAFARLAAFNAVYSAAGSFDWPAIALYSALACFTAALYINAAAVYSEELLGIKRQYAAWTFAAAVTLIGCLALAAPYKYVAMATNNTRYAVFVLELLLPIGAILLQSYKKRENEGNTTPPLRAPLRGGELS